MDEKDPATNRVKTIKKYIKMTLVSRDEALEFLFRKMRYGFWNTYVSAMVVNNRQVIYLLHF